MCQLLDDGKKRTVEAEDAVLGMIDDVGDLAWNQTRIDRMPHRAKTGDAMFDLEVPKIVPGERCNTVARRNAMTAQRIGQLSRPTRRIRIAIAVDRAFDGTRDNLGAGMKAIRMLQKRRQQQ